MNWTTIARKDKELVKREGAAALELAQLRYENTIGINPEARYPGFKLYAEKCKVSADVVGLYARAYEKWLGEGRKSSLSDCLWSTRHSEEQREAIEAVAEARGVTKETAVRFHPEAVREVKEAMAKKATSGATPAQARKHGAKVAHLSKEHDDLIAAERREILLNQTRAHEEMGLALDTARQHLMRALNVVRGAANLSELMIEEGTDSIKRCRSILTLLESALSVDVNIDWDAEMEKLTEGS
jgi:hypothetical protein